MLHGGNRRSQRRCRFLVNRDSFETFLKRREKEKKKRCTSEAGRSGKQRDTAGSIQAESDRDTPPLGKPGGRAAIQLRIGH